MAVTRLLLLLALGATLGACDSDLFTEVVDVEQDGPAPPVLFAKFTTANDTLRVFLFEGQAADADDFPVALAGAKIDLTVNDVPTGRFALAPTLLTDGFSSFFRELDEGSLFERDVYTLPLATRLQPGDGVDLRVRLPDGTAFVLSQNLPLATDLRVVNFTSPAIDTSRFDSSGLSLSGRPGELELRLARPDPTTVHYYRIFLDAVYFDTLGNVVREERARTLSLRNEERAEIDIEILPYGIFDDRGVAGDSLTRDLFLPLSPLRFDRLFCDDFAREFGRDCVEGLRREVDVYASTLPRASVDYYTDLARTRAAGFNVFAEPVVLTSQAEGLVAHLAVETVGERRVRLEE